MKLNVNDVLEGNYDDTPFVATPKAKRYDNSEFEERNKFSIDEKNRKLERAEKVRLQETVEDSDE